jgi:hypothetical protein
MAALSPGRRQATPGDDHFHPSSSQLDIPGTIPPLLQYINGVQRNKFTLNFTTQKLAYPAYVNAPLNNL